MDISCKGSIAVSRESVDKVLIRLYSLVNQPYFGGRNTSRTTLRAGRNVGLRNARYNLTTSMQSTQSI